MATTRSWSADSSAPLLTGESKTCSCRPDDTTRLFSCMNTGKTPGKHVNNLIQAFSQVLFIQAHNSGQAFCWRCIRPTGKRVNRRVLGNGYAWGSKSSRNYTVETAMLSLQDGKNNSLGSLLCRYEYCMCFYISKIKGKQNTGQQKKQTLTSTQTVTCTVTAKYSRIYFLTSYLRKHCLTSLRCKHFTCRLGGKSLQEF